MISVPETLRAESRRIREEQRTGITATDAPAILGVSPWKSALDVFLAKTLPLEEASEEIPERMLWGLLLEDPIAEEWARRTGAELIPHRPRFWIHDEISWLRAHTDRVAKLDGEEVLVEIKTGARRADWEDEPPIYYQVQMQHELAAAGYRRGFLVALLGGNELVSFEIARNDSFIERMIERERILWEGVQAGEFPEGEFPIGARDLNAIKRLYARENEESLEIDDDRFVSDVRELARIKAFIRELGEQAKDFEARIRWRLGEASRAVVPGTRIVVTLREQTRRTFAPPSEVREALLAEHPEWAKETTFRVLRTKGVDDE